MCARTWGLLIGAGSLFLMVSARFILCHTISIFFNKIWHVDAIDLTKIICVYVLCVVCASGTVGHFASEFIHNRLVKHLLGNQSFAGLKLFMQWHISCHTHTRTIQCRTMLQYHSAITWCNNMIQYSMLYAIQLQYRISHIIHQMLPATTIPPYRTLLLLSNTPNTMPTDTFPHHAIPLLFMLLILLLSCLFRGNAIQQSL